MMLLTWGEEYTRIKGVVGYVHRIIIIGSGENILISGAKSPTRLGRNDLIGVLA